ncbi:hypothetical protein WA026_023623 [Henosepilachna vigintioctopunctata]|uniref:Uncharacterized protein n=1 Tax=Henosepilachna vigintioctopunctata TaxID=420089 RepID=A0AAW1UTL3_9CUCU
MNYIGKSECLSYKVDLINKEKAADAVISNQNSSKLTPTLKDKTSDKSNTQSQKNKGKNLLTYENEQKQIMHDVIHLNMDSTARQSPNKLKYKTQTNKGDNLRLYEIKQKQIMHDVIHLSGDSTSHHDPNKISKYRTQKNKRQTTGSAPMKDGDIFRTKSRKIWLFVGRVELKVRELDILNYIKEKCNISNESEITVEKLSFEERSVSFRVGVQFKHSEQVNSGDFWPEGSVIRRFNFGRNITKLTNTNKQL